MAERSVTLYCREGGSDKVYQIHLRAAPGGAGWLVHRANGPRGKALRPGTETPAPVELATAQAIFERLLKSKLKKGYHEGEDGQAYADEAFAGRASDHRPQLLTAIDARLARELLNDPDWGLQEKANGERRALRIERDGSVRGINKLGLFTAVPAPWQAAFAGVAARGGALIDGEQVGDVFHGFDVLELAGEDLRQRPFLHRAMQLYALAGAGGRVLQPLPLYTTAAQKETAAAEIEERNGEGYVLKKLSAPYDAGRGDGALKFKFVESASCIVAQRNAKRSVSLVLRTSAGELQPVGNATIPANHPLPEAGQVVEVQYLYYNPFGAFEQPVYLGARTDVEPQECHFGQVTRLKPGAQMPQALWAGVDVEEQSEPAQAMRG